MYTASLFRSVLVLISVLNFDLYVFCVDVGRCFVHIVRPNIHAMQVHVDLHSLK